MEEQPAERAIAGMLDYLSKQFGLNLDAGLSRARRLRYLAAVIHHMKLRKALLDEFDL